MIEKIHNLINTLKFSYSCFMSWVLLALIKSEKNDIFYHIIFNLTMELIPTLAEQNRFPSVEIYREENPGIKEQFFED